MCQSRPRPRNAGEEDTQNMRADGNQRQQPQQQQIYPSLAELIDSLIPPASSSSDDSDGDDGQQRRQRQQQQQQRQSQLGDGIVAFLQAALAQYANNNGRSNSDDGADGPRPSAPPMSSPPGEEQAEQQQQQQQEEPQRREQQQGHYHNYGPWYQDGMSGNGGAFGGGGGGGGWAWTPPEWWRDLGLGYGDYWRARHLAQEQEDRQRRWRRQQQCGRRCANFVCGFLHHLATAALWAGSHVGAAAMVILPLLLFPHWMVALGLFLGVAGSLGWPVGQLAAAGVLMTVLNGMCGGMLRILAAMALFKTFVLGRPLLDGTYWRRRARLG